MAKLRELWTEAVLYQFWCRAKRDEEFRWLALTTVKFLKLSDTKLNKIEKWLVNNKKKINFDEVNESARVYFKDEEGR